jgi:hypothetical protein
VFVVPEPLLDVLTALALELELELDPEVEFEIALEPEFEFADPVDPPELLELLEVTVAETSAGSQAGHAISASRSARMRRECFMRPTRCHVRRTKSNTPQA